MQRKSLKEMDSVIIELIQGKVEEVELPVEKVDIIISEWMGYFLFYESMLNTVLFARDKWLIEGGIIMPDKANLYLAAIEDEYYKDEKIHFWEDVYGFDMSCIKEAAYSEPIVDVVEPRTLVTNHYRVKSVDIYTVKIEELTWESDFEIIAERDDKVHALIGYFDIRFSSGTKPVYFSTGPRCKYTHWKQTVFYLKDVIEMKKDEKLKGHITCAPNKHNHRDLDISIQYSYSGNSGEYERTQFYRIR